MEIYSFNADKKLLSITDSKRNVIKDNLLYQPNAVATIAKNHKPYVAFKVRFDVNNPKTKAVLI